MATPHLDGKKCGVILEVMESAEIKIILGIVIGNIACNFAKCCNIIRKLTVFSKLTEQVAEDASEIFVTRIGKEAS